MRIMPVGLLESGLVRLVDEYIIPHRNTTSHKYYMDLNRSVSSELTDSVSTFVAIATETIVPWRLDWNGDQMPSQSKFLNLGINRTTQPPYDDENYKFLYSKIDGLRSDILRYEVLSDDSIDQITSLDLSKYDASIRDDFRYQVDLYRKSILDNYLRRLLDSIYSEYSERLYLLVSECDLIVISEIASAIKNGCIQSELPFPDLANRLINPDAFGHRILNFSPEDIHSVQAVRHDADVQLYAQSVQRALLEQPFGEGKRLNAALIEAYYRTLAGRKIKRVLEFGTWLVKPLSLVPGFDAAASLVEVVTDAAGEVVERKTKTVEWYMIGVRMKQVTVEDCMRRLSDNMYPEIRQYRGADSSPFPSPTHSAT